MSTASCYPPPRPCRGGHVLLIVLLSLSAIVAIVGLVFDGGLIMSDAQNLQHASDAGATAGAMDLLLDKTPATATSTATSYLREMNDLADARVTVNIPPLGGSYTGREGFLEVIATRDYRTRFMHIAGAMPLQAFTARSVAGYQPATAAAAIMALDPNPPPTTLNAIPLVLPAYPAILGGLEVLGAGAVRVNGAVLVNTTWGGVDEEGQPAGDGPGPPYGISCTPALALSRLLARDIRVAGGVDNPTNYGNYAAGESSPLQANRLPVPDPLRTLPVPSLVVDPSNVSDQPEGGRQVATLPLITTTLQPGVYEWIEVISGQVVFEPGVYVIRGVNPLTGIGLNIAGGSVTANGVLFYLTNSPAYDAASGAPDEGDGDTVPGSSLAGGSLPSVVINATLAGSNFSPLNDPGSPFDQMLIYQRRMDRRPIVVVHQGLLGGGSVAGRMYAKWGHVLFLGAGTYDVAIVAGTVRLVTAIGMTISPSAPLPPAQDVYLVE